MKITLKNKEFNGEFSKIKFKNGVAEVESLSKNDIIWLEKKGAKIEKKSATKKAPKE